MTDADWKNENTRVCDTYSQRRKNLRSNFSEDELRRRIPQSFVQNCNLAVQRCEEYSRDLSRLGYKVPANLCKEYRDSLNMAVLQLKKYEDKLLKEAYNVAKIRERLGKESAMIDFLARNAPSVPKTKHR